MQEMSDLQRIFIIYLSQTHDLCWGAKSQMLWRRTVLHSFHVFEIWEDCMEVGEARQGLDYRRVNKRVVPVYFQGVLT